MKAPALSPEAQALVKQGDAAYLAERYADAERFYREAIATSSDAKAVVAKAEAAAVATLTRVFQDDPQSQIFEQYFRKEYMSAPHPGSPPYSDADFLGIRETFLERTKDAVDNALGAVVGAMVTPVLETVTNHVGNDLGVVDHKTHLTSWWKPAEGTPQFVHGVLQLLKLAFMRDQLFMKDLVRPYAVGVKTGFAKTDAHSEPPPWALHWRTADGSWNDLTKDADGRYDPLVGAAWTRFFRNVGQDRGLAVAHPRPNPATNPVSVRELSRIFFHPVPGAPRKVVPFLNLWAAAWIQFMNHDW